MTQSSPASSLHTETLETRPVPAPIPDPREARAQRNLGRFLLLVGQLAVLLGSFKTYRLEEPAFLVLAGLVFGGFAIHYWLAFRFKEPFWILLSLGGAFAMLDPLTATLLIGAGLGLFAIVASPFPFFWRGGLVVVAGALLMYGRALRPAGIPPQFWSVFGAVFMFRMMIYLYDVRHLRERPSLTDYLRYFFLLPNYYFLLFPVVDYQTLRRSFFQRDIHDVAQQGIAWMIRGTIQLLLYRLVYYLRGPSNAPDAITSFGSLATMMVLTYLLYLRVSGQFHIIVGMLHLFGYDLPETHRRYLLASSLTDFWRRINIYWKDFMVKIVYFPVYFRFRRSGEVRAQMLATTMVFLSTWMLHSYQWFWLRGEFLWSWPDVLFWTILGALVTINILWEAGRKPQKPTSWLPRLQQALHVVITFSVITVLWSMWNAPSLGEWLDVVTWWKIG